MSFTAPIVFLDIDGVLNSYDWARRVEQQDLRKNPFDDFDPVAVAHLRTIISNTQAEIVVSSTWRMLVPLAEIKMRLYDAGFSKAPILSKTPVLPRRIRGAEVLAWRHRSRHTGPYVCLDDAEQFYPHQPLVRTTFEHGLTATHAAQAVEILKNWSSYALAEKDWLNFQTTAGVSPREGGDNTPVEG